MLDSPRERTGNFVNRLSTYAPSVSKFNDSVSRISELRRTTGTKELDSTAEKFSWISSSAATWSNCTLVFVIEHLETKLSNLQPKEKEKIILFSQFVLSFVTFRALPFKLLNFHGNYLSFTILSGDISTSYGLPSPQC